MYIRVSVVYYQITFGLVFTLTRRIRKRLGIIMNRSFKLVLLKHVKFSKQKFFSDQFHKMLGSRVAHA